MRLKELTAGAFTLLATAMLLAACQGTPIDPIRGPTGSGGTSVEGCAMATQIFNQRNCANICHSTAAAPAFAGFDMMTPGWEKKLVGAATPATAPASSVCKSSGRVYLNKTLPATGLFLDKLKPDPPCGVQMPMGLPTLTASELDCVQRWANHLVAGVTGDSTFDGGLAGSGGASGTGGSLAPDAAADAAADTDTIDQRPPPEPPFVIPDTLVGVWTGYVQAFQMPSGSDAISLRLLRPPGGPDRIEIVLGAGPASGPIGGDPWPPPSNTRDFGTRPSYAEGFPYLAHQVSWQGNRLVFKISRGDAWQNWCAARGSHGSTSDPGIYRCAGGSDDEAAFNQCVADFRLTKALPPDCIGYWACFQTTLCTCDASQCGATLQLDATVDVTLDPPVTGALDLGGPYATFRLTRADGGQTDAGVSGQ